MTRFTAYVLLVRMVIWNTFLGIVLPFVMLAALMFWRANYSNEAVIRNRIDEKLRKMEEEKSREPASPRRPLHIESVPRRST